MLRFAFNSLGKGEMKLSKEFVLVLVTAPNTRTARQIARAALEARLIACSNLVPRIESHYWWRGKIESGTEVLLLLKTSRDRLNSLEKLVLAQHPYETPEFVVLPFIGGNPKYLNWIEQSVSRKTFQEPNKG
jgi:periplasmic divalent cation tolerance protein